MDVKIRRKPAYFKAKPYPSTTTQPPGSLPLLEAAREIIDL